MVVSDKRAYFQGDAYEIIYTNGHKKIQKSQRSRVVDLNDITGSGYDTIDDPVYKWARFAILLPPAAIILLAVFALLFA